jgi:hypothetical protein
MFCGFSDTRVLQEVCKAAKCLVPRCGGGTIDATAKETLWDKYFTGAPRPLTPSERQVAEAYNP